LTTPEANMSRKRSQRKSRSDAADGGCSRARSGVQRPGANGIAKSAVSRSSASHWNHRKS
jgi:hypothetical protein